MGGVTAEPRSSSRPTRCSTAPRGARSRRLRAAAGRGGAARAGHASATGSTSTRWRPSTCRWPSCSSLHVAASRRLWAAQSEFLGDTTAKVPFVIAVAGSVAVGKSTTARLLQTLLAAAPGPPAGRPGHHRRLPAAQRGAGGARPARPQGLPGELRPAGAAALPGRREVRPRRRSFAPVYDHQSYDIVPGERQAVDRPDILVRRGPQRAAGRAAGPTARRPRSSCPTSSTSRSTSTPPRPTSSAGTSSGSWRCAAPRSPTPPPTSTGSPTSPTSRRARRRWASGPRSTDPTCATTSRPTRSRARLVLQKAATTRCAGSCSASSEPLAVPTASRCRNVADAGST